ncbi:MAG: ABC transporter substrate-binding protein [Polyangia bacterium]|jgi:ABC-type nitrate/sulfonate/bicarbonate transport system substrate-binding protein
MSKLEKLWYTRCGVPTPAGIAVQLGWIEQEFAKDGIQLDSVLDNADPSVRESHYDHKLDNSFRQGGSVPAIWARAAGRDTRLVGLTWTAESQLLLSLPESKIRSVKDLKGRRLGVATRPKDKIDFWNATTLRAYQLALQTEGLDLKDVELVDIVRQEGSFERARPGRQGFRDDATPASEDSLEAAALKADEVDVIFHKGSRGAQLADEIGARTVFDLWKHPATRGRANNHSPRTLTVDGALADNHPDVVARIVRRVLEAGQWAADHRAEAIAYVARETNSPERWVTAAYGPDVNEHLRTDLEESSLDALAEFTTFLYEHRFLPQNFDVRKWADPRPLAAAKAALGELPAAAAGQSRKPRATVPAAP